MSILNELTEEDLIKVIGIMHDTIQDWDNGYGLSKKDSDTLIKIGNECCSYCFHLGNMDLPEIN